MLIFNPPIIFITYIIIYKKKDFAHKNLSNIYNLKKTPNLFFGVYGQVLLEQSITVPAKSLSLTHVLSLAFLT